MNHAVELVDLSDLAAEVGFQIRYREAGMASYDDVQQRGDQLIPVYLTRLLWERLGLGDPSSVAALEHARDLLRRAHAVARDQMVQRSYWRAGVPLELDGQAVYGTLILGHRFSDGLALGLGAGDFW